MQTSVDSIKKGLPESQQDQMHRMTMDRVCSTMNLDAQTFLNLIELYPKTRSSLEITALERRGFVIREALK